jgi:uncharacterized protein (TIGR00369 family)
MERRFKYKRESEVILSELMKPSHSNFSGKIHGGYILERMDSVAFACASKHSGNYCVTASVNTVNFIQPIEVGEMVSMKAMVNYVGNSSMVVGIRVEAENIRTGEIKHCNSSYFTMVAKDDSGNNMLVPGLILETDDDIRRFVRSIERKRHQANRAEEYGKAFDAGKYEELLKTHNVKVELA